MDIKKRVLIVDDDSVSRKLFGAHLASMGFETITANNGEEAWEILSGDPYFDLVITDVMMPYSSGFDLTQKLKGSSETREIPIIGTSAFHDWKKARKEQKLIVDSFVPKPVTRQILKSEIERLIGK